jgi:hypothetical protein
VKTKLGFVVIFGGLCFRQTVPGSEKEGYDASPEISADWKHPADWKGH